MDTKPPRKRSFGSSGLPDGTSRQSKKDKKTQDDRSKAQQKEPSISADASAALTVAQQERLGKRKRRRNKQKLHGEPGGNEAHGPTTTFKSKAQQADAGSKAKKFDNSVKEQAAVEASARHRKRAQPPARREATQPSVVSEGPTTKHVPRSNDQTVHSRKNKKKKKRKAKNVTSHIHRSPPGASSAKSADELFSMDWEAIERSADLRLATEDVVWSSLTAEQRLQMEERYIGRPVVHISGPREQDDSSSDSDSESSSDASSDEEEDDTPAVPAKVEARIPDTAAPIEAESSDDTSSDEQDSIIPAARPSPARTTVSVKIEQKAPDAAAQIVQGATVSRKEDRNAIQTLGSGNQRSDSRGSFKPFSERKLFNVPRSTPTNATLADTRAKFERLSSAISKRRQEASSDSDDDDSDSSTSDDSRPASKSAMRGSVQQSFVSQMPMENRDEDHAATSAAEESEADSDHDVSIENADASDQSADPANMDDLSPASTRGLAAAIAPGGVFEADVKPHMYAEPDSPVDATPLNDLDRSDKTENDTSGEDNDLKHEEFPKHESQDADVCPAQGEERVTAALDHGVTQLVDDAEDNGDSDHSSSASGSDVLEEDSTLSHQHAAHDSSASNSTSSNVDASDVDMVEASVPDSGEYIHDSASLNDTSGPVIDLHKTDAETQDPNAVITGLGDSHQAGEKYPMLPAEDSSDSGSDSSSDISQEQKEDDGEAPDEEIVKKPLTAVQSAIEAPRTQLTASQRQAAAGILHSRANTSTTANVDNKTTMAITDRGGTLSGRSPDLQAQANNDSTVLSFSDFVPGAVDTKANITGASQELDNSVLEEVFENTRPLPEGEDSKNTPPRAGTEEELLTNIDSIPHNSSQLSPASVDAGHRNTETVRDLAPQEAQAAPPPDLKLSDSGSESSEDGDDPGSTRFDVASATKYNASRGQIEGETGLNHSREDPTSDDSTTSDSDSSPSTSIFGEDRLSSSIPAAVRAAIEIATGKSPISSIRRRKMTGNTSTHFPTSSKTRSHQQGNTQTPEKKLPDLSGRQHSNPEAEQVPTAEDSQAEEGRESDPVPARIVEEPTDAASPTRKRKSPAKKTGTISEHFIEDRVDLYNTTAGKRRKVPAGQSGNPFPPIGQQFFGIIQEKTWQEPFWMIVATVLLNKTTGRQAAPTFWKIKRRWPEAVDLANADYDELFEMIKHLGLQHQRTKRLQALATAWHTDPPQAGRRYRTLHYPGKGDGKQFKKDETIEEDADHCAGALEIAHIPGCGPYSWDSWRIFCRDVLRGVADDYRGTNAQKDDFEPEWKRVLPGDKELRACLRWMWLKEGIVWNPLTGDRRDATEEEMAKAQRGEVELEDEVEAKFAAQAAGLEISSPEKITRGDYALDEAARKEMRALDISMVDGSGAMQEVDQSADWALKISQTLTTDAEGSQREKLHVVKDGARPKSVGRKRGRTSDDSDAVLPTTRKTRAKKGEGPPMVEVEETITKKTRVPVEKNGSTATVTTRRQSARLLETNGLV